jgi:hypothetical protein
MNPEERNKVKEALLRTVQDSFYNLTDEEARTNRSFLDRELSRVIASSISAVFVKAFFDKYDEINCSAPDQENQPLWQDGDYASESRPTDCPKDAVDSFPVGNRPCDTCTISDCEERSFYR